MEFAGELYLQKLESRVLIYNRRTVIQFDIKPTVQIQPLVYPTRALNFGQIV